MADTRKDKRAPLSLKVRFKSATVDEFVEHYAKDISRGGLFIKSKDPMPIGTLLKFEFQLKNEARLIHGVGRVVWKRDAGDAKGEDSPPGMGIKFIKMDPDSRQLVERIVSSRGDEPALYESGTPEDLAATPAPDGSAVVTKPPPPGDSAETKGADFFPSTTPAAEMPKKEDQTQMRHMREFLASALSEGGADAETSKAAEKEAEESRKRAEDRDRAKREAEQEAAAERKAATEAEERTVREERAKQERAAKEKERDRERERAEKDRADAERVAAKEKEREKSAADRAARDKAADKAKPAAASASRTSDRPGQKSTKSEPPTGRRAKERQAEEAERRAERKLGVREGEENTASIRRQEKSSSTMLLIGGAMLLVIGGVVVYMRSSNEADSTAQSPPGSDSVTAEPNGTETNPAPSTQATAEPSTEATATPSAEATAEPSSGAAATPSAEATAEPSAEPEPAAVTVPSPAANTAPEARAVSLRIEVTPANATVEVDGQARGSSPVVLDTTAGAHVSISADADGYAATTRELDVHAGMAPVRLSLSALPYTLEVETMPPGARVTAGSATATAPGNLDLGHVHGPVVVTATKPGFQQARQTIAPSAFSEQGEHMLAHATITLEARAEPAQPVAVAPHHPTHPVAAEAHEPEHTAETHEPTHTAETHEPTHTAETHEPTHTAETHEPTHTAETHEPEHTAPEHTAPAPSHEPEHTAPPPHEPAHTEPIPDNPFG